MEINNILQQQIHANSKEGLINEGGVMSSEYGNLIIKTTHNTSWGMCSNLPGSLPVFLHGEEPGYEAKCDQEFLGKPVDVIILWQALA